MKTLSGVNCLTCHVFDNTFCCIENKNEIVCNDRRFFYSLLYKHIFYFSLRVINMFRYILNNLIRKSESVYYHNKDRITETRFPLRFISNISYFQLRPLTRLRIVFLNDRTLVYKIDLHLVKLIKKIIYHLSRRSISRDL